MKPLTKAQIKNVKEIAEKVFKKTVRYSQKYSLLRLSGACAVSSGWVLDAFKKSKIPAYAVMINLNKHESHVFNVINDEYILDITYMQFDLKYQTFLFEKIDAGIWNMKKGVKFTTKDELTQKQIKENWSEEQIAF